MDGFRSFGQSLQLLQTVLIFWSGLFFSCITPYPFMTTLPQHQEKLFKSHDSMSFKVFQGAACSTVGRKHNQKLCSWPYHSLRMVFLSLGVGSSEVDACYIQVYPGLHAQNKRQRREKMTYSVRRLTLRSRVK